MEIFSWNVNGIRACEKKGLLNWITNNSPDILAIQETKANPEQLGESLINPEGYYTFWSSAEKKGYSGVAVYSKEKPLKVEKLGISEFDSEGRVLIAHYDKFVLINCYFPNSQAEGARLDYKLAFCRAIKEKCDNLVNEGKNIILCGDYNIAHKEIDLKNPKTNQKNPGFLPEERAWMTHFLDSGYRDIFRELHPDEEGLYTWWSYRFKAREKNAGWRIDYLCVNNNIASSVKDAKIHSNVMGSDHCPVSINLNL
ncbi:MAG: exodeoxyribonuclease III [Gammaproteobacteria bacterium]|nr:MAG: exodeoxyribonuclease III [Gammaproteobacteria bacterium]